jgi:hypothetical protein
MLSLCGRNILVVGELVNVICVRPSDPISRVFQVTVIQKPINFSGIVYYLWSINYIA